MTTASIYGQDDYSIRKSNSEEEASAVAIPSIGYERMAEDWDLIHDLLGGTKAMRKAGQKWLPIEAAESVIKYNGRLTRSILYNGYRDTINKLKNRPFTRQLTVSNLPAELEYLKDDVDGNKKSLETFAKDVLFNLLKYGIAHIFVAHSRMPDVEEGRKLTIAEERQLGARVYFINMSPVDIIGWQTTKDGNKIELIQIRQKETATEADGDYGDTEVNYINVYNKETWEVHKQVEDNEKKYDKIEEGKSTIGFIPLITIYANRKGFMTAEPPLMDLAWLNLAHWQSYSDQRNILRFTRFGLIFGKGLPKELAEKGSLEIGPTKAYLVQNTEADLKYVEHTGKSIEAGAKDIAEIEQKMRVLGNQPLMKENPNTATAEKIDESRTVSQLQSWVRSLERGLNQALELACQWRSITPSSDMKIEIYSDFEANILGGTDKELLLKMRQAGEITRERFLREEQRRSVLSEDMDVEAEALAVSKENDESDLNKFLPEKDEEEEEPEEETGEEEPEEEFED